MEQQVIFFLARLGMPYSRGLSYLRYTLPLYLAGGIQPSRELWEQTAAKYDKKPDNVRGCIKSTIRRAWLRQSDSWKEYLGVQEKCPDIREFYRLAAAWAERYEIVAVDTGKAFSETAVLPKTVAPAPDETGE